MLMVLARLACSESFWAVVKVRSPHTSPEVWYPRRDMVDQSCDTVTKVMHVNRNGSETAKTAARILDR